MTRPDAGAAGVAPGRPHPDPPTPWEVGSAFALALPPGRGWAGAPDPLRLYGSGRQALRALLAFGQRRYGWTAVHLPAYYCEEVVEALDGLLPMHRYDAGPLGSGTPPVAGPSDVVVAVSYFGAPPDIPDRGAGTLVVDATHDPLAGWLPGCRADYAFASLRKTLPLPDGGALWSYDGHELPPPAAPAGAHLAAAGRVLSAMCLKAAYLAGATPDKAAYRGLYAAGEEGLRSAPISSCCDFSRQALRILPVEELRRRRIDNAAALAGELGRLVDAVARAHTFGLVIEFDTARRREAVRRGLIERNVYPAVLWALAPEAAPRHADFSGRMLFIPTDFRCHERDLRRAAALVRELCDRPARSTTVPVIPAIPAAGVVAESQGASC